MSGTESGGIDRDIHPLAPNLKALYPYLTDPWRDIIVQRGVTELNSIASPSIRAAHATCGKTGILFEQCVGVAQ